MLSFHLTFMALNDLQYLNGQILKGSRKTLPVSRSNNICCCCKQRHQSAARALPSQLPITTGLLIPHLPNVPGAPTKPELLPLTVFQDSGMCVHCWTKAWRNELLKCWLRNIPLCLFSQYEKYNLPKVFWCISEDTGRKFLAWFLVTMLVLSPFPVLL